MEHPLRDYSRSKLAAIFGNGPGVRNAEKSIYNWAVNATRQSNDVASWENKLFRWRYKQKIVHLLEELKRSSVVETELSVENGCVKLQLKYTPQLVYRLKNKNLEMRKLATYTHDILWPEGPYAMAMIARKEKELAMEKAKAAEKDYEGLFVCRRCKSHKTTFYLLQTRSADEPMTAFITCISCGNKWRG